MPYQTDILSTPAFEMPYLRFGSGEKTMVILPGMSVKSVMGSAAHIAAAYRRMSDAYTVYVLERPVVCPADYPVRAMAADAGAAMDALGISGACMLGTSLGGMIAQWLAIDRPDLVCRLALCSTVARMTAENARVIRNWIAYAEAGEEEALNRSILATVYSDALNEQYGDFLLQMMRGATGAELERFILLARGTLTFDVTDALSRIRCPLWVAGSKADKIFDRREVALIAERTNAALYLYDGYSHAVYDEAPDFLDRLQRFFDGEA